MRDFPAAVMLALWCVPVQQASAQTAATVTGAVVDATHAPMARVAVTLEDEERKVTHRVVTDGRGRFTFTELPAGTYIVDANVRGFVPYSERLVVAAPAAEREIVLEPAEVSETITVVAGEAPRPGDVRTRGPAEPCELPVDAETLSAIGGQLQPPRMLAHPRPRFPEHLQDAEIDGRVRLLGRIGTDGRLADLQVAEGAHPDLAAAAEDAVRQWTWEEARLNCEPVEIGVAIDVRFVRGPDAQ
jgi:hypothetical protein